MVSPVDPNEVRLTGENSFIQLRDESAGVGAIVGEDGGPLTNRSTHWRILFSPAGPGHVFFLQGELTDNQVRIYSDNIALARWMQQEIESSIYAPYSDPGVPVIEAMFSRHGDVRFFSVEKITSRDEEILLTWYDFREPLLVRFAPGSLPVAGPHGIYSVMIPARKAQLVVNGQVAKGKPFDWELAGHTVGSCCLAWSETWVRPR